MVCSLQFAEAVLVAPVIQIWKNEKPKQKSQPQQNRKAKTEKPSLRLRCSFVCGLRLRFGCGPTSGKLKLQTAKTRIKTIKFEI